MNLDLAKSMELLNQAGYHIEDSTVTLQTIGKQYDVPPQQIYDTIKHAANLFSHAPGEEITIPDSPPPGTGNLTLADFCTRFALNSKMVLGELEKQGVEASAAMTLKQIAEKNRISAMDLYEMVKP